MMALFAQHDVRTQICQIMSLRMGLVRRLAPAGARQKYTGQKALPIRQVASSASAL